LSRGLGNAGNPSPRTAKQQQNARAWNPFTPGRYARPKIQPQAFTWWQCQPDEFAAKLREELPRIQAYTAPYVSREME
jgi:hypothetical protein